eukprot:4664977-Pyramimonas_sp.AAC.2
MLKRGPQSPIRPWSASLSTLVSVAVWRNSVSATLTCPSRAMSSIQSDGAAGASIDLTPPKSSGDSDAAKLLDSEDSSMTDVSSMGDGIDVEDPMEDGGGCAEDMWEDSPEPRAGALDDASMAPFASSDDSDESVPLGTNKQ